MISMVDKHAQYIIAESTKSLSLQHGTALDPDDQLWFGLRTIPKSVGICAAALHDFIQFEASDASDSNKNENLFQFVIPDLSTDPKFSSQPFVQGDPFLRFYAGVPIRSPAGYLIGIFSIVDDKPRHDFSGSDVEILKDLAATVMDHLVLNTLRGQHARSSRMVRGLGLFVEGKTSLRDWWMRSGYRNSGSTAQDGSRGGLSLKERADEEFGLAAVHPRLDFETLQSPSTSPDATHEDQTQSTTATSVSSYLANYTTGTPATSYSRLNSGNTSALPSPDQTQPVSASSADTDDQEVRAPTPPIAPPLVSDSVSLFMRASHLIRESMSVDGCAFLDVSAMALFDNHLFKQPSNLDAFLAQGEEAVTAEGPGTGLPVPVEIPESNKDRRKRERGERSCDVLGFSVKSRIESSLSEVKENDFLFNVDFLRRFLRRYPQGKIFYFEDDDATLGNEYERHDQPTHHPDSKKIMSKSPGQMRQPTEDADLATISTVIPGVRCLAFFPLWDTETKKWSAGGFVWTSDPIRILDPEEDLAYLSAFGNNIVAEKARINACIADEKMGNFISSVSHELRSPLHGILASAEQMQETGLTPGQEDLIDMINSCSAMLLDTIDSVLDFTKINNLQKRSLPDSQTKRSRLGAGSLSNRSSVKGSATNVPTDLCALVQEVIHNILSGFTFGKDKFRSFAYSGHVSSQEPENVRDSAFQIESGSTIPVMVIVSIDWNSNWIFKTQPSAWRRILTNLFGNALKYTTSGHVRVSLRGQKLKSRNGATLSDLTLSVTDTGKGISTEYLKHHLYAPFMQEDSITPGTGLGLSIVHQLVQSLDGEIEIKSEKGYGTEATVQFVLEECSPATPVATTFSTTSNRQLTRGLRACLVGFNISPDPEIASTGILSTTAERILALKSTLDNFFEQWCDMTVVTAATLEAKHADIYILLEDDFNAFMAKYTHEARQLLCAKKLMVLCTSTASKTQRRAAEQSTDPIVFVQHPFGPRTFARALDVCLKRETSMLVSPSSMPVPTPQAVDTAVDSPILEAPNPRMGLSTLTDDTHADSDLLEQTLSSEQRLQILSIRIKRPTVLLVDDNDINLKLLVMCMCRIGFPYETAHDGLEAFKVYQKNPNSIRIILMDISMPVMDGFTSSRLIREFEQDNQISPSTIVAVTGAASLQARKEASISGINQFLTKPISLKVLKKFVEEWRFPDADG